MNQKMEEEEIEMGVAGRHAMLFDDDAMAEFVNSKEALIEWNNPSLLIDRFDVRNLITNPPPSFRNLPPTFYAGSSPIPPDPHLESQLDLHRYADLSASVDDPQHPETETEMELATKDAGGYHFVPFSYSNAADPLDQKNSDVDLDASAFHPAFPVPDSLLQNLPASEKVHQIIARTAIFVSEHGGQSEIVLRVKQGDNPAFGFLMPHHHLHPYFRYLVDHPGVLKADAHSKPVEEKTHDSQASGALSLLGSVYGEDEDVAGEVDKGHTLTDSGGTSIAPDVPKSSQLEQTIASGTQSHINKTESKLTETMKAKIAALRIAINNNKPVQASGIKKEGNVITSAAFGMNQPITSSLFPVNQPSTSSLFPINQPKGKNLVPVSEADTSLVDPPSEVKRLVDRMVEIILKNGKNFEALLIEQDKKHGKIPFLQPSNQYHPYYLKVLKKAQESRTSGKSFSSGKDGSAWEEIDKNASPTAKENEFESLGSGSDDLSLDDDKKEKFKMIIAKAKKDTQDQPSKESQFQGGFTVDTAAAAAILQAATRGIRKPNLDIFSKTSNGSGSVGGQALGAGSLHSQLQNSDTKEKGRYDLTFPGGIENGKTTAHATGSEADSAEAGLTREQKLKAERLRRAKMFAAKIKSGGTPLGTESIRAVSAEPPVFGNSGLAPEAVNEVVKDGSPAQISKSEQKSSDDENEQKSRKKRHYRSRRHDGSESGEVDVGSRDENEDEKEKRSRKRHKSHHSSRHHRDRSKDSHKHRKRHFSSKRKEPIHRQKHESSVSVDEDDDRHHHHRHDSSSEDEHKHHTRRQRHDFSSEDEHRHHKRRHRHRHDGSSEDERKHHKRRHKHSNKDKEKHNKRSYVEEAELEEGEIQDKSSDQSPTLSERASREASVDISKSSHQDKRTASLPPSSVTEVPDELRAKIRQMLLATM